jgi:hypothetical protein
MSRRSGAMGGIFGHGGLAFVVDDVRSESHFPGATPQTRDLTPLFESAGTLPALGAAPVLSWFLARLAHLAQGRSTCGEDG